MVHNLGTVIDIWVLHPLWACVLCALWWLLAGAAVIKYGSLAISLPFEPNAAVALAVVLGTPAAFSLYLLTLGGKQQ